MLRRPHIPVLILALLLFLGACIGSVKEQNYLNLSPEVEYVGNESCQGCHQKIHDSYLETGMGRSLYLPGTHPKIEQFSPETVVCDSFSDLCYHPFWQQNKLFVREFRLEGNDTIFQRTEEVTYIVGSGHQTRSYILNREGYLFEVPITWYVARQKWDLSPGYENGLNNRFDREIGLECMACHTGKVDFAAGTTNKFEHISLGIDCEKCHGPGQEHVARMERDEIVDVGEEIDYSIVNPAKLPAHLQIDVCQQCHLQGVNVLKDGKVVTDFRPGMELSEVYDIFIEKRANESAFGIASHAERMRKSKCFQLSKGDMTCTTCHDPHHSIAEQDSTFYIRQCNSCHESQQIVCAAPESQQMTMEGNCVSCHMPKGGTSDIPHVTFTDHFIRIVDSLPRQQSAGDLLGLVCMTDSNPQNALIAKAYLLFYERMEPEASFLQTADASMPKDMHWEQARISQLMNQPGEALQHIEQALAKNPNNTWYLFKKGEILESLGRFQEAIPVYRKVWEVNPNLTEGAVKAGVLTLKTATDKNTALNQASQLFEAALKEKPFDKKILSNLGFTEMNSGQLTRAEQHFQKALSYDPDYIQALENMVILQAMQENSAAGRHYLNRILDIDPSYQKARMLEEML